MRPLRAPVSPRSRIAGLLRSADVVSRDASAITAVSRQLWRLMGAIPLGLIVVAGTAALLLARRIARLILAREAATHRIATACRGGAADTLYHHVRIRLGPFPPAWRARFCAA
jgi:hypothetical protein